MDEAYLKRQLAINRDRVAALARGCSGDQLAWTPDPDSWSILEVVCHLADEEEFDFPVRLRMALEGSDKPWPAIDPQGWVKEHEYRKADLFERLNHYMELRNQALNWLNSLENPDWARTYQAPFGEIRAGDLFAAWVGHDLLHLRQLVELQRGYLVAASLPYRLDYAGDW